MNKIFHFLLQSANACIFGLFLLAVIIGTKYWYPIESIHRYDFIFLSAVGFQIFLLVCKLETWREAIVIGVFHVLATAMEFFKTSAAIGSWIYPEDFVIGIGNVPLFAGFMYSAVGSFFARSWRSFQFRFENYPQVALTLILIAAIYANIYTRHFYFDFRWSLFPCSLILFWRTKVSIQIGEALQKFPVLLLFLLAALCIWTAENILTYANTWTYPQQTLHWEPIPYAMIISWFQLMLVSFVLVSLINKTELQSSKTTLPQTET